MNDNLIAVGSVVKSQLSKSGKRLLGWLRFRSNKSKTPWIKINLDEFVKMSGVSLRTSRRQLELIRHDPRYNVVVRTIYENQKWHLLASTAERLHKLQRVEPFSKTESGKRRIVKIRKQGRQLNEDQMIIGKDVAFWKAESNEILETSDSLSAEQEVGGSTSNHPLQTTFFGKLNEHSAKCHFPKYKERRINPSKVKHAKCGFGHKLTNLAHWLARNKLKALHWENAKPQYEGQFAFYFARESLQRGVHQKAIIRAYDIALHEAHADAVDQGVTEPESWRASSTISKARKILVRCECYNRWKPKPSKVGELTRWN